MDDCYEDLEDLAQLPGGRPLSPAQHHALIGICAESLGDLD
jgi:hypothetical protein